MTVMTNTLLQEFRAIVTLLLRVSYSVGIGYSCQISASMLNCDLSNSNVHAHECSCSYNGARLFFTAAVCGPIVPQALRTYLLQARSYCCPSDFYYRYLVVKFWCSPTFVFGTARRTAFAAGCVLASARRPCSRLQQAFAAQQLLHIAR